jgi:hypothetical protein
VGGIDLDLAAQAGDAQVDGAIECVGLAVRRDLQQPVAHQWAVRVLGKNLQQIELTRGQVLLIAVAGVDQHPVIEIEDAPADADARSLGGYAGEAVAQAIQLSIEYDPQPPFDCGHPDRAPEVVRAAVFPGYETARSAFRDAIASSRATG